MGNLTAATSALLHVIKEEYSPKIYQHARRVLNAQGKEAVYDYMQTQVSPTIDIRGRLKAKATARVQAQTDERARSQRHLIR